MLEVMGGMIHIKYFSKIPHLDTSLALFYHLTASKIFRKKMHSGQGFTLLLPRFSLNLLPVSVLSSGMYILFILYIMALIKWLQSTDTAAAVRLKLCERVCGVHMKYSQCTETKHLQSWITHHSKGQGSCGYLETFLWSSDTALRVALLSQSGLKQTLNLGFSLSLSPHSWGSVCMSVCTQTLYTCIKSLQTRQTYTHTGCLYTQ